LKFDRRGQLLVNAGVVNLRQKYEYYKEETTKNPSQANTETYLGINKKLSKYKSIRADYSGRAV
jgi:hypothetical protein